MIRVSPGKQPDHTCTTGLHTKTNKDPSGTKSVSATQPYQVISMDCSFDDIVSKDSKRRNDVLGLNGETGWILAQDVFSKMTHAYT